MSSPELPSPEIAHARIMDILAGAAARGPFDYGVPEYDIDVDSCASQYLVSQGTHPNEVSVGLYREPFFDAAWDVCRMGLLRPGRRNRGAVQADTSGTRFCLTAAGRQEIREARKLGTILPSGQLLLADLERYADRFGLGYAERCRDAVLAFNGGAPVAAAVMAGAACESVLLALAIEAEGDEGAVLAWYLRSSGRRELERRIVNRQQLDLRSKIHSLMVPMTYWRDYAAHGRPSGINKARAWDLLQNLRGLAQIVNQRWDDMVAHASSPAA